MLAQTRSFLFETDQTNTRLTFRDVRYGIVLNRAHAVSMCHYPAYMTRTLRLTILNLFACSYLLAVQQAHSVAWCRGTCFRMCISLYLAASHVQDGAVPVRFGLDLAFLPFWYCTAILKRIRKEARASGWVREGVGRAKAARRSPMKIKREHRRTE